MRTIIEQIHEVQLKTFCPMETFRQNMFLPSKHRGLYWLWTNFTLEELELTTLLNSRREVPISRLISHRKQLNGICKIENSNYQVVYNGIGGYKKSPASFGLRERINQEVRGNGDTVGTLNILQNSDISRWGVSYFDFDAPENRHIIQQLNSESPYTEFAKDLEMLWRLHYGSPILSRH